MNAFRRHNYRHFCLIAEVLNPKYDRRCKHDKFRATRVFPVGTEVKVTEATDIEADSGFPYGPTDIVYSILGKPANFDSVRAQDPRKAAAARARSENLS